MQVVPFWFSFLVQTLALQSTRHRLSSVIINIWEHLGYDIMSRDLKFLGFPWRMVLTKIKHRQVIKHIRQWFCWFLVSLPAAVAQNENNSREFPRVNFRIPINMAMMWEVVGGADKGGIIVREGSDPWLNRSSLICSLCAGVLVTIYSGTFWFNIDDWSQHPLFGRLSSFDISFSLG